ncbi:MAG: hypothetical protein J6E42_01430 [Firmicutes bacterium]|nr:hypothetical protein [Bacillota bacterium]
MADLSYKSEKGISKKTRKDLVVRSIKKKGFRVDRKGFGTINIDEKRIDEAVKYMNTDAEFAAFEAIHAILKRGVNIDGHENHKGRNYPSYTFAGPITINGVPGVVAVVVRKTTDNFYKIHRVLAPDGSEFVFPEIKKEEPRGGRGTTPLSGQLYEPISSSFNLSVAQNEGESKIK